MYIYTRALASSARERLPIYNRESIDNWSWFDDDWSSGQGTVMMQPPDILASPAQAEEYQKTIVLNKK